MLTYMYKLHMIENNNSSHYVYYYVHEKWRICVNLQWLLWLESMHLPHQFSELFSALFMRMNSYDPITALYYERGGNT